MSKLALMPKTGAESVLGAERVIQSRLTRFNPLVGLRPETLSAQLDAFKAGDLRRCALLFDAIEERDDVLTSVIPKRKKSIARRPWEILCADDSAEASKHKATLEAFYNNLTCTNAVDLNESGGVSLLIRQMMDAIGKKYAAHHIVWQPSMDLLTAEFQFVPLWFFENRTGRLRFLPGDYSYDGVPLETDNWMVTVGDGLMQACSVAYLFKRMPMQDWVGYCEKFGIPGIHGETNAAKDSPEWNEFVMALAAFANDWVTATSAGNKINLIEAGGGGSLPFTPLVERMDRALMSIWRGGDLATMSKSGDAVGSNSQDGETELLETDDCALITETLNANIDRRVIRYVHGADRPLAYFKLLPPASQDTKLDLDIDRFLTDVGVPLAEEDLRQRYGRPAPEAGETSIVKAKPAVPAVPVVPVANDTATNGNHASFGKFMASARIAMVDATAKDFQALRKAVETVLQASDADAATAMETLRGTLPKIAPQIIEAKASTKALEQIIGTALVDGMAQAAAGAEAENDNPNHDATGRFTFKHTGNRSKPTPLHAEQIRGEESMRRSIATRSDVVDAMHRPEIGSVDFKWGTEGDPQNNFEGGYGISKILAKHGEKSAMKLPEIIATGEMLPPQGNVVVFMKDGWRAVLTKTEGRDSSHWLLTGYLPKKEGGNR